MKRLLLSSSNIKPVNIRIVSNGVQCADLKMLKENFCISDIKDVLDGRLANWLNNIGEKELATEVNGKYPSSNGLNGKEYYICEMFFNDFTLKEYAQILFREKNDELFIEETKRITNLIVEAYNLFQNKYSSVKWLKLFKHESTKYDRMKYHNMVGIIESQIHENKEKPIKNYDVGHFTNFLNAVYINVQKNPYEAKTQAQRQLKRYKGSLSVEFEVLADSFIETYLKDFEWTDKFSIRRKINSFLSIHKLQNINYEHN